MEEDFQQGITNPNGMPICSFTAQPVWAMGPTDQEHVKYSTRQPELPQYAKSLKGLAGINICESLQFRVRGPRMSF